MMHAADGMVATRSFPAEVALILLRSDVPDATSDDREAAADYVEQSIAAMPEITRLGVRVTSGVAYIALSVWGRSPYARQSQLVRSRNVVRLAGVRLPVLFEFGRLTRSLALVGLFEHRNRRGNLG